METMGQRAREQNQREKGRVGLEEEEEEKSKKCKRALNGVRGKESE